MKTPQSILPGALPWSVESVRNPDAEYSEGGPESHKGFDAFQIVDAMGRVLFDSLNRDPRASLIKEDVGDERVSAWDSDAKRDAELIVAHVNAASLPSPASAEAGDWADEAARQILHQARYLSESGVDMADKNAAAIIRRHATQSQSKAEAVGAIGDALTIFGNRSFELGAASMGDPDEYKERWAKKEKAAHVVASLVCDLAAHPPQNPPENAKGEVAKMRQVVFDTLAEVEALEEVSTEMLFGPDAEPSGQQMMLAALRGMLEHRLPQPTPSTREEGRT